MLGAACTHGTTTTSTPRAASFELRQVRFSDTGQNAAASNPFTRGVIKANDPYRNDPGFAEAPPDGAGDLVTYADANGDGFYTPGRDPKFVLGPAAITAGEVAAARAVDVPVGSSAAWRIDVTLDAAGARSLHAFTKRMIGQRIAFVFDRLVISAPTVQSPIASGQLQIAGNFGEREAKQIAAALAAS